MIDDVYTDIYLVSGGRNRISGGFNAKYKRGFNINNSFGADKTGKKVNNTYSRNYINNNIGGYAANISINKFGVSGLGAGEFTGKIFETGNINRNFPGNRGYLNRGFPNNSGGRFPSGNGGGFLSRGFPSGSGGGFLNRGFLSGGFLNRRGNPSRPNNYNYNGSFGFPGSGGPNGPSGLGGLNGPNNLYNYYPYFFILPTIPNNNKPLLKDPPSFNSEESDTFKYYNHF